ncbi:MBL fold metallo-hydrolase [bacterium]|nr:MBL fold metallo-hydrolase [bacterium]
MRKKTEFAFILVFSFLFLFSLFCAQERETEPVQLQKISDNIYEIRGGRGANGGLFVGKNGVMVIDAKMTQESVDQTIQEIKKMTDKPIQYLINTHSDGDHVQGNRFFPQRVTIVAHENCRKEFFHPDRNGEPSEWNDPELAPFIPSVTFQDKMAIYMGEKKVELWYFGVGHTTGDSVVYFPEEKTAFIGDQFFAGRPQLIHSYKGGNSFEYVQTVHRMLETLDAETFCSGHSKPVDRRTLKKHVTQLKKMQSQIRSMVEKGQTLEEVKEAFDEKEQGLAGVIFSEISSRNKN